MVVLKMIVQCKHSILLLFPILYSLEDNSIGAETAKMIKDELDNNSMLYTLVCDLLKLMSDCLKEIIHFLIRVGRGSKEDLMLM